MKKIIKSGDLLTTLLISLFVFVGCENPSGIGLDVQPDEKIDVLMTDTITVEGYTVRDDSAFVTSSSFFTFGLFQDPQIGETRADLALELAPASNFKRILAEATIDSAVLVLPYAAEFFGDTTNSSFTIEVRQLDEEFNSTGRTDKNWNVRSTVIGSKTIDRFGYKQTDSLMISRHINGKDTLIKVRPQLRIPLSTSFFKELFSITVDSATLATYASFRKHVKGLYLSVNKESSTGIGGLGALVPISDLSGVELVFRQLSTDTSDDQNDDDEIKIDTVRNLFPIYPAGNSVTNLVGLSSAVKHQYVPAVKEQLEKPNLQFDKLYSQAPNGLRTRIVFPNIASLKGKNIMINKAELILPVAEEGVSGTYHTAAQRLTLYREDVAGRRQNIPDGAGLNQYGVPTDPRSLNFVTFGGWHQKTDNRYVFHLTAYIQDVLQGKINGNELFVAPVSIYDQYVPVLPSVNTGSRSIFQGGTSSGASKPLKLVIHYIYTKPDNIN